MLVRVFVGKILTSTLVSKQSSKWVLDHWHRPKYPILNDKGGRLVRHRRCCPNIGYV